MGQYTLPKASNFNIAANKRIQQYMSKDPSGDQDEANININLNYTVGGIGETLYQYKATGDDLHIINRIVIQVCDEGQMLFNKFGKGTTLVNGIIGVQGVHKPDPMEFPTGPVVLLNRDWARFMGGVQVLTYDANKQQMYIVWNLLEQGTPAVLDGEQEQYAGIRVSDDITDVSSFTMFVHGVKMSKGGL